MSHLIVNLIDAIIKLSFRKLLDEQSNRLQKVEI